MSREPGDGGRRALDRAQLLRLIVGLVMVALIVAFAVSNSQTVEVDYLVGSNEWRLFWVIIVSAVIGSLATLLIQLRLRRRH